VALGIGFIEISAIAGAIEIIVGVLKTRAVGMSLDRLPVYSWAMLVFAIMIVVGFPAIILGTVLLELERAFHWPFFIAEKGGDPLCGSTCSGSSATRRSTSSSCPRQAWSR
jgi:cytochrome c oxidase subunit I+III